MAAIHDLDLVLLGATGYTGKLTAEYITQNLSTSIKWAVAGRSENKLQSLVNLLNENNSNRTPPSVITTGISAPEMASLAKKTKIIINTIGPYHKYSSPIVEACASNGTHYIDATGETPWIREMIQKHEDTAKKTSAILIPSVGLESAPSDIIAYKCTQLIRKIWDCGVMDMVASIHQLKSSGASGGTLASALGLFDAYPAADLRRILNDPFSLSPSHLKPYTKDTIYPRSPEPTTYHRTLTEKLTGVFNYPRLGTLTTSITAKPNEAIVHRSSGLAPLFYGFNFTYEEYMAVASPARGMLIHFFLAFMTIMLAIPPIRAIAKMLAPYSPGAGPEKLASENDVFELRAVAVAEQLSRVPRKAMATIKYEGSLYALTGLLLAEAAATLLDVKAEEEVRAKHGKGGFLTPSCLGDRYVERCEKGGMKVEVRQIGDTGSK